MSDELSTAKVLGGVGSILVMLTVVHWAVGIAGLVLLFIAFKKLSDYYNKPEIFKNAMISLILQIVGIVIFGVLIASAIIRLFFGLLGVKFTPFTQISTLPINYANIVWIPYKRFLMQILLGLVLMFVFLIISAVFFRRALNTLAEVTGQSLFGTAGLLYLIGSCLSIIVVGGIVIFVSYIILTIAFFTMEEKKQTKSAPASPVVQ